jgi:amphi-Trp domain-containing protein
MAHRASSAAAPRVAPGGVEKAVADVNVQQTQALSRQQAARFIAALAEGLGDDGKVAVRLGSSTLELSVASQVHCDFEVAVDGDQIELKLRLNWSTSGRASVESADGESDEDAAASGEAEPARATARDQSAEPVPDRRSAPAKAVKPDFNGVDSAAVRAWAAANGLKVSARGRIKGDVIKAYRAAGN